MAQIWSQGSTTECVIAVSKSHEFLLKVRRLSSFFSTTTPAPSCRRVVIFFHDDTADSTSTTSRCFSTTSGRCRERERERERERDCYSQEADIQKEHAHQTWCLLFSNISMIFYTNNKQKKEKQKERSATHNLQ